MKILFYILFTIGFISFFKAPIEPKKLPLGQSQEDFPEVNHNAFQAGEKAKYLVHFGPINAGYAHYEIKKAKRKLHNRDLLHVIGVGESAGLVDLFFHVEDRYQSFMDEKSIFPWLFIRDVHEGGYEIHQKYKFFQDQKKVENKKGEFFEVPFGVHDMISAGFKLRTQNLQILNPGDTVSVVSFMDDEIFPIQIKFVGREEVEIQSGTYRCLRFNPIIQSGRVFNTAEDLEIWLSDDENKMPILCKANIVVGSVKVEIMEYEGLANPLAKIE